jgi:hypothetical protein
MMKQLLESPYEYDANSEIFQSDPITSRPTLGPAQSPIQLLAAALSLGLSGRGVKLTTQLQLVPRSRIRGSIQLFPRSPSWRSA